MSADVKLATLDLRLWSGGCGFTHERILISHRGLSAVRTGVSQVTAERQGEVMRSYCPARTAHRCVAMTAGKVCPQPSHAK
jgi:hypothetical protein